MEPYQNTWALNMRDRKEASDKESVSQIVCWSRVYNEGKHSRSPTIMYHYDLRSSDDDGDDDDDSDGDGDGDGDDDDDDDSDGDGDDDSDGDGDGDVVVDDDDNDDDNDGTWTPKKYKVDAIHNGPVSQPICLTGAPQVMSNWGSEGSNNSDEVDSGRLSRGKGNKMGADTPGAKVENQISSEMIRDKTTTLPVSSPVMSPSGGFVLPTDWFDEKGLRGQLNRMCHGTLRFHCCRTELYQWFI